MDSSTDSSLTSSATTTEHQQPSNKRTHSNSDQEPHKHTYDNSTDQEPSDEHAYSNSNYEQDNEDSRHLTPPNSSHVNAHDVSNSSLENAHDVLDSNHGKADDVSNSSLENAHDASHGCYDNDQVGIPDDTAHYLYDDHEKDSGLGLNSLSYYGGSSGQKTERVSLIRVWASVSVIFPCVVVSIITLTTVSTQYFAYRIAQDRYNLTLNSSAEQTNTCGNYSADQDAFTNAVQRDAADRVMYSAYMQALPALVMCLLVGSYSDYIGRKPVVLMSLAGLLSKVAIFALLIYYDLDLDLYYVASLVDGVSGSNFTLTLAVTAMIVDVTSHARDRAGNFAITEGVLLIFGALSQVGVGYMIDAWGYFPPMAVCCGLMVVALVLAVVALPETATRQTGVSCNPGVHLKKVFGFYTSGPPSRRILYILGLAMAFIIQVINTGRLQVEMLFTLTSPICWDSIDIGIYNSIRLFSSSILAVTILKLLKNRLSLETIGLVSCVSAVGGFIVEALAVDGAAMYISALVGCLSMVLVPIPKALLSVMTAPSDTGALFSGLSAFDAVASLVSSTAYTGIYNATLDTFKGMAFIGAAGYVAVVAVILGVYMKYRRSYDHHHRLEMIISAAAPTEETPLIK